MACDGCARSVELALSELAGVCEVDVNVGTGEVLLPGQLSMLARSAVALSGLGIRSAKAGRLRLGRREPLVILGFEAPADRAVFPRWKVTVGST